MFSAALLTFQNFITAAKVLGVVTVVLLLCYMRIQTNNLQKQLTETKATVELKDKEIEMQKIFVDVKQSSIDVLKIQIQDNNDIKSLIEKETGMSVEQLKEILKIGDPVIKQKAKNKFFADLAKKINGRLK